MKLWNILLSICAICFIAIFLWNIGYAVSTDVAGGEFGDIFGFSNSVFSGGALLFLIFAISLQKQELAIIKEERNDTRKLLQGQEEINAAQKVALEQQIFENSFFNLMSLIDSERRALDELSLANPSATKLRVLIDSSDSYLAHALYTDEPLSRGIEAIDGNYGYNLIDARPVVMLFLAALGMTNEDSQSHERRTLYRQILQAVIDPRLIPIWAALSIFDRHRDPRIYDAFMALDLVRGLREQWRERFSRQFEYLTNSQSLTG